jgi:hypothetical protein
VFGDVSVERYVSYAMISITGQAMPELGAACVAAAPAMPHSGCAKKSLL